MLCPSLLGDEELRLRWKRYWWNIYKNCSIIANDIFEILVVLLKVWSLQAARIGTSFAHPLPMTGKKTTRIWFPVRTTCFSFTKTWPLRSSSCPKQIKWKLWIIRHGTVLDLSTALFRRWRERTSCAYWTSHLWDLLAGWARAPVLSLWSTHFAASSNRTAAKKFTSKKSAHPVMLLPTARLAPSQKCPFEPLPENHSSLTHLSPLIQLVVLNFENLVPNFG